jgi:hypothetical protein
MENLINRLLRVLKEHVNQNNDEIRYNQEEIRRILAEAQVKDMRGELDLKNLLNKELHHENNGFIKLQLHLTEFLEQYGHLFTDDEGLEEIFADEEDNYYDVFEKTIEGALAFDENHPYFFNHDFQSDLLDYYKRNEDYEMCAKLVRIRNLSSKSSS